MDVAALESALGATLSVALSAAQPIRLCHTRLVVRQSLSRRPGFGVAARELPRAFDRASRHDAVVEHHEGEATVTLRGITFVVIEDRLLFPLLEPTFSRNLAIVFVDFAIAVLPRVDFTVGEFQPAEQPLGRQFDALHPAFHVVLSVDSFMKRAPRSYGNSRIREFRFHEGQYRIGGMPTAGNGAHVSL